MTREEFVNFHVPVLEKNEARHGLMLGLLAKLSVAPDTPMRLWTFGKPGACAIQTDAARSIILGDLSKAECHKLAEQVAALDFGGVQGPDETAHWFVDHARQLGLSFADPMSLGIQELRQAPTYPDVAGAARPVTWEDYDLYAAWFLAFHNEAIPSDPVPTHDQMRKRLAEHKVLFWEVDGRPVSLASSSRGTRNGGGVGLVYTPPEHRRRGYAGAVTAAVSDIIFASGKSMVFLFTDLHNPYSNRCYHKIGFRQIASSWQYPRQ
jgi:RimJ/RimL family protein N-acetyltransferase